jgi:ATP-binding cassette subfamily B protein
MDEATANMDPENENELIAAFNALTKKKTVIMIDYRLKTIRKASSIYVLDQKRIVESGTHETLMKKNGLYVRFVSDRKRADEWLV